MQTHHEFAFFVFELFSCNAKAAAEREQPQQGRWASLVENAEGAAEVHLDRDLIFRGEHGATAAGTNAALIAVNAKNGGGALFQFKIVFFCSAPPGCKGKR